MHVVNLNLPCLNDSSRDLMCSNDNVLNFIDGEQYSLRYGSHTVASSISEPKSIVRLHSFCEMVAGCLARPPTQCKPLLSAHVLQKLAHLTTWGMNADGSFLWSSENCPKYQQNRPKKSLHWPAYWWSKGVTCISPGFELNQIAFAVG